MPAAVRQERNLNVKHYPNVISDTLPLLPINGRDETLYDHLDHDEVVFLDADCAQNDKMYADHLRRELLLEQQCLLENAQYPGITEADGHFYFLLQWDTSNDIDCLHGITIDFEAFCISKIEYEQIFTPSSYECVADSIPNYNGVWFFDDIEGDINDGLYSSPYFDANNLIVYVVDTATNLQHEHFDHIPNGNKEYVGTYYSSDTNEDHGTHVTLSEIGCH